jgi:hypothetical protein
MTHRRSRTSPATFSPHDVCPRSAIAKTAPLFFFPQNHSSPSRPLPLPCSMCGSLTERGQQAHQSGLPSPPFSTGRRPWRPARWFGGPAVQRSGAAASPGQGAKPTPSRASPARARNLDRHQTTARPRRDACIRPPLVPRPSSAASSPQRCPQPRQSRLAGALHAVHVHAEVSTPSLLPAPSLPPCRGSPCRDSLSPLATSRTRQAPHTPFLHVTWLVRHRSRVSHAIHTR